MAASARTPPITLDEDQRIIMNEMTWKDFEVLQAIRGEGAGVRIRAALLADDD